MSKQLTASSYLILEDGDVVPFDEASEKDRKQFQKNAIERVKNTLTDYYSQHLEEFIKL